MRYLILFLLWTRSLLPAQTVYQAGLTRELNSGKKPVPNVFIKFEDAVNTTSDDGGKFRLAFQGKQAGDVAFLEEIKKQGYEVVNEKELEITQISKNGKLTYDIILARIGVIAETRAQYYGVSLAKLQEGYAREKARLKKALQESEIEKAAFFVQLTALENQLNAQQASLTELSEQFARVNFDDVGQLYQDALRFFQEGKIDSCKQLLQQADLLQRTSNRLEERARIQMARDEIEEQEAANEAGLQEDIKLILLQAHTHLLDFEIKEAESLYLRLIELDSTNIDLLEEVVNFFETTHQYERAVAVNQQILNLPHAEPNQRGHAYSIMGRLAFVQGQFEHAATMFRKGISISQSILRDPNQHANEVLYLGAACEYLGYLYKQSGQLDSAKIYFDLGIKEMIRLVDKFPTSATMTASLGSFYQKLGEFFEEKGQFDSALYYFYAYGEIMDSLVQLPSRKPAFINNLVSAWISLGDIYAALGQSDSSLYYYRKSVRSSTFLSEQFPLSVYFLKDLTISYERMGDFHGRLGQLDSALSFYRKNQRIALKLYEEYPTNISFQNIFANSVQKAAVIHMNLGQLDSALVYSYQDYHLCRNIVANSPDNLNFQYDLAGAANTLGRIYYDLPNLDSALTYFSQDYALLLALHDSFPENTLLSVGLTASANSMGQVVSLLGDDDTAMDYFRQAYALGKRLASEQPEVSDHQSSVSITSAQMGTIFERQHHLDSAIYYYQIIRNNSKALWTRDSSNLLHPYHYGASLQLLGDLYFTSKRFEKAKNTRIEGEQLFQTLLRLSPQTLDYSIGVFIFRNNLGESYDVLDQPDSALYYLELAQATVQSLGETLPDNNEIKSMFIENYFHFHEHFCRQAWEIEKAKYYLEEAIRLQRELVAVSPNNVGYLENLAHYEAIKGEMAFPSVFYLLNQIKNEDDTLRLYELHISLIDTLARLVEVYPDGKAKLSEYTNTKGWLGMFLSKFSSSKKDFEASLKLNPTYHFPLANQAHIELLLGNFKSAKRLYLARKDRAFEDQSGRSYRDVFLENLDLFENAGIIPEARKKDVSKIRKLLAD